MARITIEDCEKVVGNRFDLVVLAAQRARQIFAGDKITINEKKDEKKTVIALREIAEKTVFPQKLKEKLIEGFRSFSSEGDLGENLEELMEEDTYKPYVGIEMKALEEENNESNGISIVNDEEIKETQEN